MQWTPRCWILPDGRYLIEGPAEPLPVSSLGPLQLDANHSLKESHPYHVVAGDGTPVTSFPTASAFSLEDTLYIYDIHTVIDDQLRKYAWELPWEHPEQIRMDLVSTGLIECQANDLPFDPLTIFSTSS